VERVLSGRLRAPIVNEDPFNRPHWLYWQGVHPLGPEPWTSSAGLVIPSEPIPAELPPGKDLVWLRGTLEAAPWDEIASFRADVCMHMAWITTPGIYLETPENFRFLQSSIHFLRKVRESGCRHIFGLGTCIEYKITNEPLSEELTQPSRRQLMPAAKANCVWPWKPRPEPTTLSSVGAACFILMVRGSIPRGYAVHSFKSLHGTKGSS